MLHSRHTQPSAQKTYYGPDGAFVTEDSLSGTASYTIRRITAQEEVPFTAADALLREHARVARQRAFDDGGPEINVCAHVEAFWAHFDAYLPRMEAIISPPMAPDA